MNRIQLHLEGNLVEIEKVLSNIPIELRQMIISILVQEAFEIAKIAKQTTTFKDRSGDLRQSIHSEPIPTGGKIRSGLDYAKYQEYGTEKMRPKHFLKDALESRKPVIRMKVINCIKEYFRSNRSI